MLGQGVYYHHLSNIRNLVKIYEHLLLKPRRCSDVVYAIRLLQVCPLGSNIVVRA